VPTLARRLRRETAQVEDGRRKGGAKMSPNQIVHERRMCKSGSQRVAERV
jgi:hypothetical protein